MSIVIKPRDRDLIIQALSAGVVPRSGLRFLQVGRAPEVSAVVKDIDRIADHGTAIRFVIGEYGSGKTFFLNLVRMIALEKKLVTIHADLSPDRRLHASDGHARALYAEAVRNMATRTMPEGGALGTIIERILTDCRSAASASGMSIEACIEAKLAPLHELIGGFDFVTVIKAYCRGVEAGNDVLKVSALRWLRGEYTTKTEARKDLDVRSIVDDANVYDSIKVLSVLVRSAGYSGLLVLFDEMVNIYKLQNSFSRKQNYEQLLRIVNDCIQGSVTGLGFMFGGTPDFLMDTRRGVYSYEALQSRLSENAFASGGLIDLSGPVIRLQSLRPEDLYILLGNIRTVFKASEGDSLNVPDEALTAFMEHCSRKIGSAYFTTPRNTIRAFVQFLSVLLQNPSATWSSVLALTKIEVDRQGSLDKIEGEGDKSSSGVLETAGGNDDLASFRL